MHISVKIASKAYGKSETWVRAGIITGYLPIGIATRNGKRITRLEEVGHGKGWINYYISPERFFDHVGTKQEVIPNEKWVK